MPILQANCQGTEDYRARQNLDVSITYPSQMGLSSTISAHSGWNSRCLEIREGRMDTDSILTSAPIDRFADLPVPVEVRVGKRTMRVREVCGLETGSVFALDRPAGEALDLIVGDVHLASAEVVVVEDRLGVRITEFNSRSSTESAPAEADRHVPAPQPDPSTIAQEFAGALDGVLGAMTAGRVRTDWRACEGPPKANPQDDWLWWSETVSLFPAPAVWIGGLRASWTALVQPILSGLGGEKAAAEDIEATCRDVVTKSVGALAQTMTAQLNTEITTGDATSASTPAQDLSFELTVHVPGAVSGISLIAVFDEMLLQSFPDTPKKRSGSPLLPSRIGALDVGVHVMLGRTRLLLEDVFKMTVGSVIELGRSVDEPADILINNRLIARGQVVLCGSSYGVRVVSKVSRTGAGSASR